ncbi:MAG TPA: STAS domain-containing protein [Accumulibacter sp.]|nr:STAS domain-containing protein [Accumulibacter sp.]HMX21474.1 STAS domain-containing protein [Accumulibacter sp.]HMY06072.1 STAS domain-containing protein [Accumulibacter sp.]HNC18945.1 STAS domain-containing protein [Accumulibacter sp.]HND78867.1 STAS domain-containing protein [Accumulibacter sp.]
MVAKPAAVPRPSEKKPPTPTAQPGARLKPLPASLPSGILSSNTPAASSDSGPLTISEFVFSEFSAGLQVEPEVDPIDAQAEEVAMQYASGQDRLVQQTLENAIRFNDSTQAERLWLLLFDFFRLTGKKEDFESLSLEYAASFEKSPPTWRQTTVTTTPPVKAIATTIFKGELYGDNDAGFAALREAIERHPRLRIDLSKVHSLDDKGCERLMNLLEQARKYRREVDMLGTKELEALVDPFIILGKAQDRGCWFLKLELCQIHGQIEEFEDLAINYAVTFEISPPSWEASRASKASVTPPPQADEYTLTGDAYPLKGEVKNTRFADLLVFAAAHDPVIIDCSEVTRMDFLSAGALLNVMNSVKTSGRKIVFRHPHLLLAELFRVVGLTSLADIVFAKY